MSQGAVSLSQITTNLPAAFVSLPTPEPKRDNTINANDIPRSCSISLISEPGGGYTVSIQGDGDPVRYLDMLKTFTTPPSTPTPLSARATNCSTNPLKSHIVEQLGQSFSSVD